MRIFSLIDDAEIIKKILKHLELWEVGRKPPARANDPRLKPLLSKINPHRQARMVTSSMPLTRLRPTFKKSGRKHTAELCPNLPKWLIPNPKITVDNKTRLDYSNYHSCR
jgi:hypothetical protein